MPGSTLQRRLPEATDRGRAQNLGEAARIASLVHWPARLVPPPRETTGSPSSWQTATVRAAASIERGTTTPIGTCRKLEASVEYAARLPSSKRTSPSTRSPSADMASCMVGTVAATLVTLTPHPVIPYPDTAAVPVPAR